MAERRQDAFKKEWQDGGSITDRAIAWSWYKTGWDDALRLAAQQFAEADRAGRREKLQAKVIEYQGKLLVAYRVGMTGERVGRILDGLDDAEAALAALAPAA